MSEEEKQIHLYMHSKNELGLATLCVEKDKEIEILKQDIELLQNDLDNANSKLKDYLRRNIRAINLIENMLLRFDTFSALEVKTIKYILEEQGVGKTYYERNKNKAKSNKRTRRNSRSS